MKKTLQILIFGFIIGLLSCKENSKGKEKTESEFIERIQKLSDSIKVDDIVVKNLFKSQILAHQGKEFDSLMIIKKVYEPHKELWDNCYGMIFGEENAQKFNTPNGMVKWNKTLYPENKKFFDKRAKELMDINLDSILKTSLRKFNKLVDYETSAKISILFTPLLGIGFGGCTSTQFAIELNSTDLSVSYIIEKALPHELNHLAYEPFRENDFDNSTALRQTIDEGFACYFTWLFFDKEMSKYEVVENMTEQEWNWYLENEKKIFQEVKQYFDDESGDNPLLRNNKLELFKDAPKTLNYWLGFRIVEAYVKKNGAESWKDIYEMNAQDVLDKSGYEKYINELK